MDLAEDSPFHAHIYFARGERHQASELRTRLLAHPGALFVGGMISGKSGPHTVSQFEVHFLEASLEDFRALLRSSGLRILIHPLTDDDLADHTVLAEWIGEPVELDLSTLDPPGMNQGISRFGKSSV